MKRSPLLAVLSLLLASRAPAAELVITPETLNPSATLELRFETPMVDKARVGSVEKESPLIGDPAVTGEFKWTSTRSGQFRFTQPPAFATTYKFQLREGLKDAAGKDVEVEEFGESRTEGFRLVTQLREYPYYGQIGVQQRVPRYLLQFSDAVDPAAAVAQMSFMSKTGTRIAVKARPATGKDFRRRGYVEYAPTWAEQISGTKPQPKPDEERPNALIVESKEPLPFGESWTLLVPKTFANQGNKAALDEEKRLVWGNVFNLGVMRVVAEPHFDSPHAIEVHFNKPVACAPEATGDEAHLRQFIKVDPAPPGLKIRVPYGGNPIQDEQGGKHRYANAVTLEGDFALETKYTVTVSASVPAADEIGMAGAFTDSVTFHASNAYVSTSAFQNTQLSSGNGIFDVYAANYKNLRIRVKQLSDGDLIQARMLYQKTYNTWDDGKGKNLAKFESAPFEDFPGKVVFDKSYANSKPLEKATRIDLKWSEVLGQTPAAPVFVEIEGSPQEGAPPGIIFNRSIVEFTDIGLLVKNSGSETLAYVFSLRSGAPLPGTQVTFTDNERGYLGSMPADDKGIARLESKGAKGWVLAKRGADCTALDFGDGYGGISLWRHGVRHYAWDSPWKRHTQTFIFSDRPVYKPGDIAHVKAIARQRSGDNFSLGMRPLAAKLTVSDPRGRAILTKEITFSANGSWDDEVRFPETLAGWYTLQIAYPKKDAAGEEETNEYDRYGGASLSLRVDDYKPNTFEVSLDGAKHKVEPDRITVPLRARYYMGKALSQAKTSWSASLMENFQPPAEFADFSFGDVERWWHYGEDRDEETADEEKPQKEWGANGTMELADDGTARIELPLPPPHKEALPQTITVYADVTDVNQQTISASTEFQIPGADFLIGVKKDKWYGSAGKALDFEFTSMTPDGKPFQAPVPVEVKIERQEWNTVRVQAAGGEVTTKNQVTLTQEMKGALQVEGAKGAAKALTPFQFIPKKGGTYFLTATAKDAKGLNVISRVPFYVLGGDGYPWSWEDGEAITLQPDKTMAKPGEEVTVVVKSPISGTALVTVERNRVHRSFLAPITPENPVVKVPITDEDSPNAFISVIVVRGAVDSPQPDKMPEYKLGYCEITVPSVARKLFVDAKPTQSVVRPGEELTVNATVKDSGGNAVAGSEVTLYAVDEGVLSLMSYETPLPFDFFHASMGLAVNTYTTLGNLMAEDMDKRDRGNKGIVVGGGGDEGGADAALRKNFVATATWNASLLTDKDGRVSTTFKVPDSLTRYRIMAIAAKDADRFGTGDSSFTVNKPLMVEPAVPRFAHVGDELLVKAVLHNTTAFSGDVEVELKLDDTATLVSEERPYALVALLKNRTMTNDGKLDRRSITLKAGETTALAFPVKFVKSGTCAWQWRAHTVKWSDAKSLADAVESKFEVTQPAPALREVHYFELTSAKSGESLLKGINPQLLESDGKLRLDFNRSRLGEVRDALEHLLHYPYGCVEQTTSSTLPWLALSKYEPMFPDLLQQDKVRKAIIRGAERLLTMQTEEGGLSYWPGGEKPLLWASAYGGFGLIKAKEWGAPVPQEAVDKLTSWISNQLRDLKLADTKQTYDLCDSALALYTLAKAGKPEPSYQNLLYLRRDDLPEMSRLFLAMAMCLTPSPENRLHEKRIAELLKESKGATRWERYWLGDQTAAGLRMIVCAHLGLTDEGNKYASEVLARRNGSGHWGTTFANSWVLLGLAAGEKAPKDPKPLSFEVAWGDKKSDFTLANTMSTVSSVYDFDHKLGAKTLRATVPAGQTVRGRVELKAWPDLKTFQAVQKGFGIKRRYERLTPTGALEEPKNLRVGDLIVVTLDIKVLKGNRYLAVEDPLPSVFEPVNPEFATQNQRQDAKAQDNAWSCDHRELRNDKALFFTDDWSQLGNFELKYLARVIAEGDVIAPPARIEAMYQPDHYGLSNISRVQTLPMTNGGNVAEK